MAIPVSRRLPLRPPRLLQPAKRVLPLAGTHEYTKLGPRCFVAGLVLFVHEGGKRSSHAAPGLEHSYTWSVKCDKCNNEATVHEVTIRGGKRHEKHMCEQCARSEGVAPGAGAVPHQPVTQLLSQFVTAQAQAANMAAQGPVAPTGGAAACSTCGVTFAQFRTAGVLGCPDCYTAFEPQLGPMLARAHEGGTHHVGKTPARSQTDVRVAAQVANAASAEALAMRVSSVKKRLADAIGAEQYELAAKLRDELASLDPTAQRGLGGLGGPGAGSSGGGIA